MPGNKKLFLSAVSREFLAYRELLTGDLKRPALDVAVQEDFIVTGASTLEKLDDYIRACDGIIHLVGKATGDAPEETAVATLLQKYPNLATRLPPLAPALSKPQPGFSYTQWEAYLAMYHGRPLFVYRPTDFEVDALHVPRDPRFVLDPAQVLAQREHYQRISALGHDRGQFLSEERLSSAVLRDLVEILPRLQPSIAVSATRLRHTAVRLIGRDEDLARLDMAWNDNKNVVIVRAFGGMGKTSLVATWMAELAMKNWRGAERVFDWSFYSQGASDQGNASAEVFIANALKSLGDPDPTLGSPWERGARLAGLVGKIRCLLVLDGLEPIQYPPGPMQGKLKDAGIEALLKGLSAQNAGLCVVTTRERVPDIQQHYGRTADDFALTELTDLAGAALLHDRGATRVGARQIAGDDQELRAASREVRGHGLTLQLLGQYLRLVEGGDILKRDTVRLADADREYRNDATRPYGHAFKAMEAYENWFQREGEQGQLAVLRLLGLFDRPASRTCLDALRKEPVIAGLTEPVVALGMRDWAAVARRLEEIHLLTVQADGSFDAHPLLREYFGQRLRATQPEAWQAAHRRLYEHLCATTKDKPDATLEDLQPLYQAVGHGCHAGLQQEALDEVFFPRLDRREAYGWKKLGAFGTTLGAVACFFETPWSRVSPALMEADQGWLLNEAALALRALGRLTEALEPMRAGLDTAVRRGTWRQAAQGASNLSELEITLGEVAGAVGDAEQSVTYADRSGDAFQRMGKRTTFADALHQAGRRDEAEARFREAEQMQAESQPAYPLLYSLQGFRYCDLLLSEAEREAGKAEGELKKEEWLALCRAVAERAAQTLEWATDAKIALLTIALDHLTLGRAALYAAILESHSGRRESAQTSSPSPAPEANQRGFTSAASQLDQAVSGLRRAGVQHQLPRGLLTRAWLRSLTGPRTGPESAQGDLDEAWEIAERGPMPLFLADIHLHRARLFFREANYPWDKHPDGTPRGPKDDLAAARVIIERCGYWRRREELDDAEAAAKSWPDPMPPVAEGKRVMRKTIVELDLKGYSDVARELEENLSAEVVMHFNDQIQTFVDAGLSAVSLHREDAVMATTGDGAILALDSPSVAHRYALAVHNACRLHNHEKTVASAKRWFRVGIATGDLAIETSAGVKRMAGSVIARAVRLETASNVGEILVDTETYASLSDQQKSLYGPEETIQGKRDEVFAARRCVAVPGIGVAPTPPAKARSVPAKPSAALVRWREKLEYLQEQLAIVTAPAQKFELKCQIAEAKQMIEELGG